MTNFEVSAIGGASSFELEEAVALMNLHVVRKEDLDQPPTIEQLGYVAGVVSLNSEIEVLIKFLDVLLQINKAQFKQLLEVVNDD